MRAATATAVIVDTEDTAALAAQPGLRLVGLSMTEIAASPDTASIVLWHGLPNVNEVQTLTITGTPDAGTFLLTFLGQTTTPLAFNAANEDITSALEALSTIGDDNVAVTGDALPANPKTITFAGDLGFRDVPLIVANGASLGGGSAPTAAVTQETAGSGGTPIGWFSLAAGGVETLVIGDRGIAVDDGVFVELVGGEVALSLWHTIG